MRLIDLSHEISNGMVTYPGIPAPVISTHMSFEESAAHYSPGTEFEIGSITLAANTGTYLDTPAHRHRGGFDLAGLALEKVAAVPGQVVRCRDSTTRTISAAELDGMVVDGRAVLFDTGWSRNWGNAEYFVDHPHLGRDCIEALVEGGAAIVGIDSLNIDATADGTRPAHTELLGAGIPIVEHMTLLDELPDDGFELFAIPPRISGMATFPVRAFARVQT